MVAVIVPDEIDFAKYTRDTEPQAKMRPAVPYFERLERRIAGGGRRVWGRSTPWAKLGDDFRFRPGEVTLWLGLNADGKSLAQSNAALHLMRCQQRVAIVSLEMPPDSTLERMMRQATMGPDPTKQARDAFRDWTVGKLWIYDHRGYLAPWMIVAVLRYCYDVLRIQHVCIDSLMKVVKAEDDYNGQKNFVDDLCMIAQETGMHVHLVHHQKKPENGGSTIGSRYDGKGSGAISDQVDNVIVWWRNRAKAEKAAEGRDVEAMPDAVLKVDKQRHGEWEGKVSLYFHAPSMQYLCAPNARPIDFMGTLTAPRIAA